MVNYAGIGSTVPFGECTAIFMNQYCTGFFRPCGENVLCVAAMKETGGGDIEARTKRNGLRSKQEANNEQKESRYTAGRWGGNDRPQSQPLAADVL